MEKKPAAMRRQMIQNALFGLLVAVVLSVETLAMSRVFHQHSSVSVSVVQPTPTMDLGTLFQGR
ncbi:MAG: hypothetical protein H7A46_25635 [Verrucomicrobiales bacterium]|nr:hypothetical protein [Verrucomicrobiales bacterium]